MFVEKVAEYAPMAFAKFGNYFVVGADVSGSSTSVLSDSQMTSVQNSLTSSISNVIDMFVKLLPIIALTTGAVFAIRFIKKRFSKVEHQS